MDGGLVPAFEIMVANTAIRNLIREEKTHQMDSVIAAGGAEGMRTMDQSLFDLVVAGRVASEVALQCSIHQEAAGGCGAVGRKQQRCDGTRQREQLRKDLRERNA